MQKSTHARILDESVWLPAVLVAAGIVFADILSKAYFFTHLKEGVTPLFQGLLDLVIHRNYGIVANAPLPQPITIFLTVTVMLLILRGIRKADQTRTYREALALSLILGGAIGNLIDRVLYDFVRDWMLLFGRSAINLADIAIVAGALWYISLKKKSHLARAESS